MNIQHRRQYHKYVIILCTLLFSTFACTIPNIGGIFPSETGLPDALLTNAAATIMARIGATQTQEALAPPPVSTGTSTATTLPPGLASPTSTMPVAYPPPVQTDTPTPTSTQTSTPTTTTTSTTTSTVYPYSPVPTHTRMVQMGTHFFINGVNLPMCPGSMWAIFAIYNNGTNALESMYLFITDLTTGANRLGPITTNTPFMNSDRTCALQGIDRLSPGGVLFVGGQLNSTAIKGHTLHATLKLCSGENLTGACYQTSVDFVVP